MKIPITALLVSVTGVFLQPLETFAAEGLVTCTGGSECNFCSLVSMVNGLVEWVIIIITTLVVLLIAFAGFRLITAGGDATALQDAKKYLVNAIIGILIMLAGWTMVDTFLKVFAGGDLGVWNAVECGGSTYLEPASQIKVGSDVNVVSAMPETSGTAGTAGGSTNSTQTTQGTQNTPTPTTSNGSGGTTGTAVVPTNTTIPNSYGYTVESDTAYTVHDPADPSIGIMEAGPTHGQKIIITTVLGENLFKAVYVDSGNVYIIGCRSILPQIPGCPSVY